ncbi:metal ABC transporter substrate-binding protein [Natranaeroarchaeum aerophilus]|uniref:Metal ABC transporter substrate-binding protein n=1 Tax=Natranaeroarchaeum aerophilus TaxID=2917711 RepID=A0AAE3FQE1_9EURY|nr:metal ABC transporter substrate-binding protein [Natranaeroarchaeum aerophilus]MCL9813225.1 metal ABC transporter substrate-binding protein [Natranaeroarchaeum aerophilus]
MVDDRTNGVSRRKALAIGGSALSIGIAGCASGTPDDEGDGPVAVASFFTFYDFARQVAEGTSITAKNLVPTGLHGHGWEPDPSIQVDIVDADAFVHVGPDFQPWADRAIQTARDDGADTEYVNARKGIDLINLADTVEEDEQVDQGKDPHFWLDPERAKGSVDNIRDGLSRIAPDEEEQLADNAEAVKEELDVLDEEWQTLADAAERDVAFLAAHNAFEYVGQRYGLTLQPLVKNLAADDDVRPTDMQRAQDTIEANDIRNIGAAIFEPRRPAQQLRDETDVEAYYPVTPYAGTTEEWADQGWGYFDIAREINMNTFRKILEAGEPEDGFDEEWRNFE